MGVEARIALVAHQMELEKRMFRAILDFEAETATAVMSVRLLRESIGVFENPRATMLIGVNVRAEVDPGAKEDRA